MDLRSLQEQYKGCQLCGLAQGRKNMVFGRGEARPDICIIGEGPGAEEDAVGFPFVGKSGELLNEVLQDLGGKDRRQEAIFTYYITNVVCCRPPNNRDPLPEEIAACKSRLDAQLKALSPSVIVTLGKPASRALSGFNEPMGTLRSVRYMTYNNIPLVMTYHPSFILRNGRSNINLMVEDFMHALRLV